MRILFALAGIHRVERGAEVAFISIGRELARAGHSVTLVGSGPERSGEPYQYIQAPAASRNLFEGWPRLPTLRNEAAWEEASFVRGLLLKYRPCDFDITVTCGYPFTNWALRRPAFGGRRPRHVFVTQNGDWPAYSNNAEFRFFNCEGLVCTNPDYFERNRARYRCALIPNGVDLNAFGPGDAERDKFGLPRKQAVVLMVSALIESKNVAKGIAAVAAVPDAILVVAGDGPLRGEIQKLAAELLPGRYRQLTAPAAEMPALYRCADVFMHLSVDESFGNVFLEAMASGLPIVASDTPRTRWIVGDDAFYPPDQNSDSLSAAIIAALDRGKKNEAAARHRAAEFGWSMIARRYADFFGELEQ